MWRLIPRGFLVKYGVPFRLAPITVGNDEHHHVPRQFNSHDVGHTRNCARLHSTQEFHDGGHQYDDSSDSGKNQDGPQCKWKQKLRSFRDDMWSLNNPGYFLEVVGWGTAVITGFQVTELCHRSCHGYIPESVCWMRSVIPIANNPACFNLGKCVTSYLQFVTAFVSTSFGRSLESVRYILPPSSERSESAHRSDDSSRRKAERGYRGHEVDRDENESEENSFLHTHHSQPTVTASVQPTVTASDISISASVISPSSVESAVSSWCNLALDYVTVARCSAKALKHARCGEFDTAVQLWQRSSLSPLCSTHTMFNLAVCYENGLGIAKDLTKAAELYGKAAELGHARSAFNLAILLLQPSCKSEDSQRAFELLEKAANLGLKEAQRELGVLYTEQPRCDMPKAALLFEKAASQKDARATYFLGICHENGWGVERNEVKAAELYRAASAAGHVDAVFNLGVFFESGLGGLPVDVDEAVRLYRAAANAGSMEASEHLRVMEQRLKCQNEPVSAAAVDQTVSLSGHLPTDSYYRHQHHQSQQLSRFYQSSSSDSESDDGSYSTCTAKSDCDSFDRGLHKNSTYTVWDSLMHSSSDVGFDAERGPSGKSWNRTTSSSSDLDELIGDGERLALGQGTFGNFVMSHIPSF